MVRRKPPIGIVILSCIIIWHLNGCDVKCDQTALRESYPTKFQKEDETLVRYKIPDCRSNYYKKQLDDRSNSAGDKRIPNQLREYGYISSLGQRRQVRVPKLDENEGNQISHESNKKPEQRYSEKRMLIYYGRIGRLGCRSKLLPNVGTSTCETGNSQNRRNTEKNNERKILESQRIISRRNSKHTAINDSEFSNRNQLYRKNMENKSNYIRSVQETRALGNRRAVNTVVENRRTQQQYNSESGNLENRRKLSEDLFLRDRKIMDRRNFNSGQWKETEMNDFQTQTLYQDTSNENHDFQTETFKNLRRTKTSDSGRQTLNSIRSNDRRVSQSRRLNSRRTNKKRVVETQTGEHHRTFERREHETTTVENIRRKTMDESEMNKLEFIRSNKRRVSQTITSEDQRNNKLSISERHTEEHHRTLDRRGSEATNIRNMKTNKMHDSERETSEITRSSNRRISHSRTMEYRRTNERRIMQRQTAERCWTFERRETETRTLRNMRANNIHGSERLTLEFSRLNERRVFQIRSSADERKRDLNVPEREIKGHHRTFLRCEFQTRSSENLRTNRIYDSVGQITELSPSNDRRASRSRTMENRRSSERLIVDRQAGEYLKTLEERDYQKNNLEALKRNKICVTERHNFDASRLNDRRVLQIRTSKIQRRNVLGVSERETGERRQPLERFETETRTVESIRRNKRNGSEKQVLGYSRTNGIRVSQVRGGENQRIKKMHDSLQHANELQARIKIRNTQTRSLEIHRINEGHNSILKTFKYVISNIRRNLHRRFLLNKQKVILRDNSKTRDLKNVKNTNSETSKHRRSDRSNSQYRTLQPFTRTSGRYSETISLNEGGYYKLLRYERLNAETTEYEIMVLEQHQLSQRRYLKQQRRELKRSSQNKPEVRQKSLKYYKIRSLKITRKADRGMYETKTLKNIRATERWDSEQKRTNYRHHVDTSSLEITSLSDIRHSESTVVKSYILYKSSRINIRRLENRGKSARTTRVLELREITQTRWRNLKNLVGGKRDNPVSMIRESRRTNRKYGSQVRAVEIRKLKYSKGFGRLRVEKYDNIQRYCSEIRALESRRSRNMCYPEMIVNVNRRTFETNEPREIIVKNSRIVNSRNFENRRKVVNYHDLTRYTLENQRTTKEFEFLNQEKTAYNLRLPADKINKDILLHKELGHSAKLLVLGSEKRNNEVLSAVHSDQDEGRIFSEMKHRTWTLLGIPVVTTTVLFVASLGLQPNMKSFEL